MLTRIFSYLKHEQQLIKELLVLTGKQQRALIQFDTPEIERICLNISEISSVLKETEESRIKLLMNELKMSRKEATLLKLSAIEPFFEKEELVLLKELRKSMKDCVQKLNSLNSTNRILANRARNSVSNLLRMFNNGEMQLCNVTI